MVPDGLPTLHEAWYALQEIVVEGQRGGGYNLPDIDGDGRNSTELPTELSGIISISLERNFWDEYYDSGITRGVLISDLHNDRVTGIDEIRSVSNPNTDQPQKNRWEDELSPLQFAYRINDLDLALAIERVINAGDVAGDRESNGDGNENDCSLLKDIFIAIANSDFNLVYQLIGRSADPAGIVNAESPAGYQAIRVSYEIIRRNPRNKKLLREQNDIIKMLLARGAHPSFVILQHLVLGDNFVFLNFLLEKYPDLFKTIINTETSPGLTLLTIAAMNGNPRMFDFLVRQGANVNVGGEEAYTALMFAVQNGHESVVRRFIQEHVYVNAGGGGSFPIIIAAQGQNVDIVNQFILAGTNINVVDSDGYSPLLYAIRNGRLEIVRALLSNHANFNVVDPSGDTPLIIAARNGDIEIVRALIDIGANIDDVDKDDKTAEDIAEKNGHNEIEGLIQTTRANQGMQAAVGAARGAAVAGVRALTSGLVGITRRMSSPPDFNFNKSNVTKSDSDAKSDNASNSANATNVESNANGDVADPPDKNVFDDERKEVKE